MIRHKFNFFTVLVLLLVVLSCKNKGSKQDVAVEENLKAKAMLEGIWVDAEEYNVTFRVKGDTIYYPDSVSQPVKFQIVKDTMILLGNSISKYPIVRQTANIFDFKNQDGDVVRLVRSDDSSDSLLFVRNNPVMLNQKKTIKRDTIVSYTEKKYHCYVQINPTYYKVYRSFTNAEGIEVENVYYDNIIHISIFSGAEKMFSKDFRKDDFKKFVPSNLLKQTILSDIELKGLDGDGFHYKTQLAIPDSPSSFIVDFTVTYNGKVKMRVS